LTGIFDRRDFELIQMDTDSIYMAISAERLEDIVRPELQTEFEAKRQEWLAWDDWSGRTPNLFKLECEGSRMIALCSKCYFVEKIESKKNKFETTFEKIQKELKLLRTKGILKKENNKLSTKGMSKKQNEITWQRFKAALDGSKDMATNIGFRMNNRRKQKLGLSAYYDKRWVLEDGIHTEPMEFHR